jgi:hypothetical protein
MSFRCEFASLRCQDSSGWIYGSALGPGTAWNLIELRYSQGSRNEVFRQPIATSLQDIAPISSSKGLAGSNGPCRSAT